MTSQIYKIYEYRITLWYWWWYKKYLEATMQVNSNLSSISWDVLTLNTIIMLQMTLSLGHFSSPRQGEK